MISILIVEDNFDKYNLICNEILSVDGIDSECVYHATDIVSAKRYLKEKKFSLLILDLNLPNRMGGVEEKMNGIKILEFINNNNRAISPSYILGVTAYDDAFNEAQKDFSSILWQVIKFDYASSGWKTTLKSSLNYLVANDKPPYRNDGKTYHYDIGIICALEEELEAVLAECSNVELVELEYDHNQYYKLTYNIEDKLINAIATCCPSMGMSPAGILTHQIISKFRPRIITMAGICAGVREKTNFGDILIADPCFEWGSGKLVENGDSRIELRPANYPWRVNNSILSIFTSIKKDKEFLDSIYLTYDRNRPATRPGILIDAMASGSSVLQSQEMIDSVKKQHKNLIGIEMESYAVFTACALADDPKPLCVSLKSVCDFGDSSKSDDYHHYASYTSAKVLTRFILDWFTKNS
ncbi:TPA: response regulator [Vibrio parahaemolyticus]|uniref:phosphorylase family protein n=2 Tax=Vibrio TaxID=662 RepID=UPI0003F81F1C|nr:response regulator [Vibrio parahaemolyticus]